MAGLCVPCYHRIVVDSHRGRRVGGLDVIDHV